MAKTEKIHTLKDNELRESTFTLDEVRRKISSIKRIEERVVISDEAEAILCLANEIHELKEEIKKNSNKHG